MSDEEENNSLPPVDFLISAVLAKPKVYGVAKCCPDPVASCLVCFRYVTDFVCQKCVKRRLLSQCSQERYAELSAVRRQRHDECEQILRLISAVDCPTSCRYSAELLVPQVSWLATVLSMLQVRSDEKRRTLSHIRRQRSRLSHMIGSIRRSCNLCTETLAARASSLATVQMKLQSASKKLAAHRQALVKDLFTYIFPIERVQESEGANGGLEHAQQNASISDILTDAALTNYYCNRWMIVDTNCKALYRVGDFCFVPDFSDYSLLKEFLFSRNCELPSVIDNLFSINKVALGSCPSLAFATHLTLLLSRILDIRLPFSVACDDFCVDRLSKQEFETAVLRLNCNVTALALSQGLPVHCVEFSRPFYSLLSLLENLPLLGYRRQSVVDRNMLKNFDVPLLQSSAVQAPRSVSETQLKNSHDDWESIDEYVPEWLPSVNSPSTLSHILNSAGSSVASIFKAIQL